MTYNPLNMKSTALLLYLSICSLSLAELPSIEISKDGQSFITSKGEPFVAWGVNYDHDERSGGGELLDEYWDTRWSTVVEDLKEIKALGANVVRIHLQVGRCMKSPTEADPTYLAKYRQLLLLCNELDLYLDVTGLACYHKSSIPEWFDALSEEERWHTQAVFWQAIAQTGTDQSCIFCYDLMNEPIVPSKPETEWLTGALGGKYFVQRLTRNPHGRDRKEIARSWINKMVTAIHSADTNHLITLGVIPWALSFPKAKPFFYDPEVCENLDFTSVHFYPRAGGVDEALTALKKYDIGKPLVIEEIFPLKASLSETATFIEQSRPIVDGLISFYWGKTATEYEAEKDRIPSAIKAQWLRWFKENAPDR